MTRRYLVVSDLHICDYEEHPDGWKAHKHPRYSFDSELHRTVNRFSEQAPPEDELVLILNGDIFDFDLVSALPANAPWPVNRRERRRGLDATEEKSAWKLERILDYHPEFLDMLAEFLAAGHRVIYVLGNHDRELHYAQVQSVFVSAIARRKAAAGSRFDAQQMTFEPWFYYVPNEIYVEHGQQYDSYNVFTELLEPTARGADSIVLALPFGSLSGRHLLSRMGYFSSFSFDYVLGFVGYVGHWLKYWLGRGRSLPLRWLVSCVSILIETGQLNRMLARQQGDYLRLLKQEAERKGLNEALVVALDRLKHAPFGHQRYRMFREYWFDRVAVVVLAVCGAAAVWLADVAFWVKVAVPLASIPLVAIYDRLAHNSGLHGYETDLLSSAREIADLVDAPVITCGHNHKPMQVPLRPGVSYVNTGTWAPTWLNGAAHVLKPGLKNFLTVIVNDGAVTARLETADEGGENNCEGEKTA